jgi:hypothetical protein
MKTLRSIYCANRDGSLRASIGLPSATGNNNLVSVSRQTTGPLNERVGRGLQKLPKYEVPVSQFWQCISKDPSYDSNFALRLSRLRVQSKRRAGARNAEATP